MKRIFILSLLVLSGLTSFEQEEKKIDAKDVPAPVMAKFKAFYGEATKVKWEKEGNNYAADFKTADKKKVEVTYSPEGNTLEKEWVMKKADLPKAVSDSLAKKFPGAKPEEITKIDRNGLMLWEVEFELHEKGKEEVEMKVEFTPEGKIWSKKATSESDEKKKDSSTSSPQVPKKEVKKDDKKDQK